jgi:hypothetical protein
MQIRTKSINFFRDPPNKTKTGIFNSSLQNRLQVLLAKQEFFTVPCRKDFKFNRVRGTLIYVYQRTQKLKEKCLNFFKYQLIIRLGELLSIEYSGRASLDKKKL